MRHNAWSGAFDTTQCFSNRLELINTSAVLEDDFSCSLRIMREYAGLRIQPSSRHMFHVVYSVYSSVVAKSRHSAQSTTKLPSQMFTLIFFDRSWRSS